jgi:outer membrane protein assembly factor BamB
MQSSKSIFVAMAVFVVLTSGCVREVPTVFRGNMARTGVFTGIPPEGGKLLWSFETGGWVSSSPVVADGLVYFGSDDRLFYAVDCKTGQQKWQFATGGVIASSPAVADRTVYFGSRDNHLYALDARDGELKWKFRVPHVNGSISGAPALAGCHVYFGAWDGNLYALDSRTGTEKWRFPTNGRIEGCPAILDGIVYVVATRFGKPDRAGKRDSSTLYAVDAQNGTLSWKLDLQDKISRVPACSDGTVYFGDEGRTFHAVDARTGKHRWTFTAEDAIFGYPAVADDTVFFSDESGIFYALGGKTGRLKWVFNTQMQYEKLVAPSIVGDIIYLGSTQSTIYVLDKNTGEQVMEFSSNLGNTIYAPTISGGVMYFGNSDNNVYAFE